MFQKEELVKWSPTFACGIKLVDDQHKELLNLVNDMFNHVTGDKFEERAYFDKIIQKAVKYVEVHFQTEEQLMLRTKFPGYAEHKREHAKFIRVVGEQIEIFEEGKKMRLIDFTKFLKEWILSHVAVMDKVYFDYFKKIASRKADGRLTIDKTDIAKR
ncbi:MAG: bacteriohemerythrin [Spirochaetes bacterium]|nr:bacteriohemerythrin [Spirochaetota bacterium]